MNRKTLSRMLGLLTVFGFGIVASLNSLHAEDETRAETITVESANERDGTNKPTLRDLRAEIGALRAEMQEALASLQKSLEAARAKHVDVSVIKAADSVEIFKLDFIPARDVAEVIQNVILDARVSVLQDENRIVVAANAVGLAEAAQTIEELDRPRQQVRIESYVYEIAVDDLKRLGLMGDNEPEGAITSRLGKHFDLKATIIALSATEDARLLARPNFVAYDRTEAKFQSVQEVPFQALTQTSAGGNIGTTQFREAGVTIEVTPQITASGKIIMEVRPEFSVMQGFFDGQPVIDRRSATTTVVVKGGEPIVISGLRSQRPRITAKRAEPSRRETELLIIIKAEIVE